MIFFAFLLLTQTLWARNIVLLTSLPENQTRVEPKIERILRNYTNRFADTYKIIIKHQADQEDLFASLNDPETHALFWLSHGGYIKSPQSKGVKPAPMLLDYQKDNVAKTFQKIHPHLKYVGVVGCNSEQILGDTIKARADLDYYIPKKKVIAQFALKKALKHFAATEVTRDNSLNELPDIETVPVSLIRKTGKNQSYKSLKVFLGGKLLTVLPKMAPDSQMTFTLNIPVQKYGRSDLKFIFESGQSPYDEADYIGELQLSYKGEKPWVLFAKPTGEPFGTNERIFNFKGYTDIFSSL